MKSVVLRLEGPMQSWGTQGRFGRRDTDTEPSKSGVIGLVGAALGMPRDDEATLARLCDLTFAVRVDREGTLLRDYHTVGAGQFRGAPYHTHGTRNALVTERFYLADAAFTVALGGEDHALVDAIAVAVQSPRWVVFLGRRACVPSVAPFLAVLDATPEEAVRGAKPVPRRSGEGLRLRLMLECPPGDGAVPREDVPLSFQRYGRKHGRRFVRTDWVDVPSAEAAS